VSTLSLSAGVPKTELERWLERRARRERQIVALEEALLAGRLWRYSFYRLRFFFLTFLVESVAHALTVVYLFRSAGWGSFLLVAVVLSSATLTSSLWWGALEAMRAQIRDLHRSGRPHLIAATVGGWLTFTAVLSACVLAGAIGWTAWHLVHGSVGAVDAFVAVGFLRVAVELPVRCYHSGVYAMRRVYKPVLATLAPELAGIATILSLWWAVGLWALVVSSLLVTAASTILTLVFTRRTYHFLGLSPSDELGLASLRAAMRGRVREALLGGFSHAVMALDSLVVLALIYGGKRRSAALLVLLVAAPALRAGIDWARLLYFDLKRLELRLFRNLRRRFDRHTAELAWALGFVFWACAAGLAVAFEGRRVSGLVGALLAFFLARSLLARIQINAFADRAYGAVIASGLACVAGLAAVGPLVHGEGRRLTAVAIVAVASAAVLTQLAGIHRALGEPGTALLTLEWLRRLGNYRQPVRVGSARVVSAAGPDRLDARTRDARNRWRLGQLAGRTAGRLRLRGAAAWIGPDRVVWFEPRAGRPRVDAEWLELVSGGLVDAVVERECPAGEEALLAAGQGRLLGYASQHVLTAVVPVDIEAARRRFLELVPGGVVYSPDEPEPPELVAMSGQELRAVLRDAVAFARDLRLVHPQCRLEVTSLCSGGELRLIFLADRTVSKRARIRWRQEVTRLNVRASIGGEQLREHPRRLALPAFLRA